jgi:hypothetical protein
VRLFNVGNGEPGELFMDTCGMSAFGIPDLEHQFRDIDPGKVAGYLFDLADHLFENGDVIRDRDTVDGVGGRWRCRREFATLLPQREVLHLVPDETDPSRMPISGAARCPSCAWTPSRLDFWECRCGMMYNAFDSRGRCPACQVECPDTACLTCGTVSAHRKWYA